MKGIDIVVGGSVGDYSAFMAQAGRIVVCGDAGDALGDSLYEAVIYVRGKVKSFGADAHEEPMKLEDLRRCGEAPRRRWHETQAAGVPPRRVHALTL
jgi:glutamate synthase domain-containing protein 3